MILAGLKYDRSSAGMPKNIIGETNALSEKVKDSHEASTGQIMKKSMVVVEWVLALSFFCFPMNILLVCQYQVKRVKSLPSL